MPKTLETRAGPSVDFTQLSRADSLVPSQDSQFTDFVRTCSASLLRAAFLLTGDQRLAEDLVQDALARTYRAWSRLERAGNASAYTRKTMYHLQVSWWRRRRVAESFTDDFPTVSAPHRDVDLEMTVHAALLKLTVAQRAAIVLRYFEDRTEVDTAAILGCSPSTVKTRTRRGLDKLRKLLPDLEGILP